MAYIGVGRGSNTAVEYIDQVKNAYWNLVFSEKSLVLCWYSFLFSHSHSNFHVHFHSHTHDIYHSWIGYIHLDVVLILPDEAPLIPLEHIRVFKKCESL